MKRREQLQSILAKDNSDLSEEEQSFLRIHAQFLSKQEIESFSPVLLRRNLLASERSELRRLLLLDKLFPRPVDWTQDEENREAEEDCVLPLQIERVS